jgi:cell wall-associated NlpC family hydrolase
MLLPAGRWIAAADTPVAVGEPYAESADGREQSPASAAAVPSVQADGDATYVVQAGDSLWAVARRHGVSVRALAQGNGLDAESVLPIGLRLKIPPAAGDETTPRFYVVQKGDCLWTIARPYGTTARALADMNGLDVDAVLPIGLRLEVPGTAPTDNGDGDSFVQTAMEYRGVRYRWGGMTTRGMDCSGLVARVLATHGIEAPHSSKALYKLGRGVSRTELQPGDLVFFNTSGRGISHVGLYVDEGKFIHASSGRGRVRVDTLERGYYHRRYVGARRVH